MAIEPIEKLTRPLSEGKKVASHDAPEDYLKRAVEQFIIEFPEFEDLDIEDLYKEMEKKGYFSDQYAMSDPHPDAERADMMDIISEKYFGKSYDKLTPKEIELLEENWDELISQTKQPRDIRRVNQGGIIGLRFGGDPRTEQRSQGIMQLASHSGNDVIQSAMIWMAGLPGSDGNPIGMNEVIRQLNTGETDINGLVNAYMDAKVDSN